MGAPILSIQHCLERPRVVARITTRQAGCQAALQSVIRGITYLDVDPTRLHVEDEERTECRGLIPTLRAMNDERALDRHGAQRLGNELRHLATVSTDQMK